MVHDILEILAQAATSWEPPTVPEDIPQGDMPGDKVWIGPQSVEKANATFRALLPLLGQALGQNPARRAVVAISGGSGVGKTCVSALLTYYLNQLGVGAFTLSGDNYPRRFPQLNDMERMRVFRTAGVRGMLAAGGYTRSHKAALQELQLAGTDPDPAQCGAHPWLAAYQQAGREALSGYLGTGLEQEYDQLSQVLRQFKDGAGKIWLKRMGRDDNALWYEEKDFSQTHVLVLEWTHSGSRMLEGVDIPVLLASTPAETRAYRLARGRDANADTPFITMVLELEQAKLEARAKRARLIVSKDGQLLSYAQYAKMMEEGR